MMGLGMLAALPEVRCGDLRNPHFMAVNYRRGRRETFEFEGASI